MLFKSKLQAFKAGVISKDIVKNAIKKGLYIQESQTKLLEYSRITEAEKFPFPTHDGEKWFINKFNNLEEISEEEFNRRFSGGRKCQI